MRRWFPPVVLAALVVAWLPSTADEGGGETPNPIEGLRRSEIVALFGEPDKRKWSDGTETLVYKLRRVADEHVPAADERLVDLPGVGRCVRRIPRPIAGFRYEVAFEPTHVNSDGDMEGGGVTHTQSQTVELDGDELPSGRMRRDDDHPKGKVRLFLTLDWNGKVAEWKTKGGK